MAVLTRILALGLCVAWVSAAPAQMPPGGSPDKSDDVPRLDDLLPSRPGERPAVPAERPSTPPERREPGGETRSSQRWGAVAYTADGAFGAAYGIDTRGDAERLAIGECLRESTDKQDCSRGVVVRQDSWFHIQFCKLGTEYSAHVTTRPTLAETNQAAAEFARTSKFGADGCRMVPNGLFHSGGMHTKM
jgi:Domain of unknown function (DUF4189)